MKTIKITVEVRKYAVVEAEVSDRDYFALKNTSAEEIIPGEIESAIEQAEADEDQRYYDYCISNPYTDTVLVDTGIDYKEDVGE